MKFWVGVTDNNWYDFLARLKPEEVNFWQPGGKVESLEQWKWSGYRATAGKEKAHPALTTDWVLGQFSGKRNKAESEYRQFVKWGINKKSIMLDVKG